MPKPVDLAALDPEARRLAERGAREAFGMSLDDFIDDFHIAGEAFDEKDLETLVLAGTLAENADRINASKERNGHIVHATPKGTGAHARVSTSSWPDGATGRNGFA